MLNIFEFINYRRYLQLWIENQGERAYGLKGKLAKALGISSSLLSQVIKGEKSFTADQTSDLTDYLGLTDLESDYFHLMVELDRAANHRYKEKLQRKIKVLQEQSQKIVRRVPKSRELTDEQKAIYYSSWLFTGIRTLTAVPEFQTAEAIAKQLKCEPQTVIKILRFLIEHGLCKENQGQISYGSGNTHIEKESPFANKHHQNWRLQAIQQMEQRREKDLFFTSPMSLSKEARGEIRKMIPNFIQEIMKISGPSDSEMAMCLNIDWFEY